MSYHNFLSLGQVFQGDLSTKLTKNVISEDFAKLPCNCNQSSKTNDECMFGGDCRKSIVIYKAECRECKMLYIGNNTQQKLKLQIIKYLGEVCILANKGKTSDSCVKHSTNNFQN